MNRHLLIIDPTLQSMQGHSYLYNKITADYAVGRYTQIDVYADHCFQTPEHGLPVHAELNRLPIARLKRGSNCLFTLLRTFIRRKSTERKSSASIVQGTPSRIIGLGHRLLAYSFSRDTLRILHCHPKGSQLDVFIQHARMGELLAMPRILRKLCAKNATFHLVLRYGPEHFYDGFEGEESFATRLIALLDAKVRCYTDSIDLSHEFVNLMKAYHREDLGIESFPVLPVPFIMSQPMPTSQPTVNNPLRLAMMGVSRMDKGFASVPSIVEILQTYQGPPLEFAVQATMNFPDPRVTDIIKQLETYIATQDKKPVPLTLLKAPAPQSLYEEWLRSADIMLLPYSSTRYASSTSCVFVEALHWSIPIVTWDHTWMATQIRHAADHGFAIGEILTSLEQLPETLQRIAIQHSHYQEGVAGYLKLWKTENDPSKLINALLAA